MHEIDAKCMQPIENSSLRIRILYFVYNYCPWFQVTLITLLTLYTCLGGFIFTALEAPKELHRLIDDRQIFLRTNYFRMSNRIFWEFS
jgi:hypothetical protein